MNLKEINEIILNLKDLNKIQKNFKLINTTNKLLKFKENYCIEIEEYEKKIEKLNNDINNFINSQSKTILNNESIKYFNEEDLINISNNTDYDNFLEENKKIIEEINQNLKNKNKENEYINKLIKLNEDYKNFKKQLIKSNKVIIELNNCNSKLISLLNQNEELYKNIEHLHEKNNDSYENILSEDNNLNDRKSYKLSLSNINIHQLNDKIKKSFKNFNINSKNKTKVKNDKSNKYKLFMKDTDIVFKNILEILNNMNNYLYDENIDTYDIIENILNDIDDITLNNKKIFDRFFDKFSKIIRNILNNIVWYSNNKNFNIIKNLLILILQEKSLQDVLKNKIENKINKFNANSLNFQNNDLKYFLDFIYNFINQKISIKVEDKHLRKVQTLHLEFKEEINKLKNNKEIKVLIDNYDKINKIALKKFNNKENLENNDFSIENIDKNLNDQINIHFNNLKHQILNECKNEFEIKFNSKNTYEFSSKTNYFEKILKLIDITNYFKEKFNYLVYQSIIKINNILNELLRSYKKNESKLKLGVIKLKNFKRIYYQYFDYLIDIDINKFLNSYNWEEIYCNILKNYSSKIENITNNKFSQKNIDINFQNKIKDNNFITIIIDNHLLFLNLKLIINKNK